MGNACKSAQCTTCAKDNQVPLLSSKIRPLKQSLQDYSNSDSRSIHITSAVVGLPTSEKDEVIQKFYSIYGNKEYKTNDLEEDLEGSESKKLIPNDKYFLRHNGNNYELLSLDTNVSLEYNLNFITKNIDHINSVVIIINGIEYVVSNKVNSFYIKQQNCFGNQIEKLISIIPQDYYKELIEKYDNALADSIPFLILVTNHNVGYPDPSNENSVYYSYLNLSKLKRKYSIRTVDYVKGTGLGEGLAYLYDALVKKSSILIEP